ncbi:hypothetical protein PRIPAC_78231, partial [Pristionchus pacificus]|uniref:CUB domain-containing protein n=1 Tax=Pristionchus pacificus TaxID=54126 RepID=A0A2A6CPD0_PRIPA
YLHLHIQVWNRCGYCYSSVQLRVSIYGSHPLSKTILNIIQIAETAHCSCPSGFELIGINGLCGGSYVNLTLTPENALETALAKCGEMRALPVMIRNDEVNFAPSGAIVLAPSRWPSPVCLTASAIRTAPGLTCNTTTHKFEWVDGSPLDYKHTPNYDYARNGTDNAHTVDVSCSIPLHPSTFTDCDTLEHEEGDNACYRVCLVKKQQQRATHSSGKLIVTPSCGSVSGLYLGATISGTADFGNWSDGSEENYENFAPGFPKAGYGECLAMDTSTSAGQWANIACNQKLPFACLRYRKSDLTCSSQTWKNEGTVITSPDFPYSASTPCDYSLMVPENKRVELEIIHLEANSCCDYLIIYDGYLGKVLANLTGEVSHAIYTTTSENIMKVSWQPKGGVGVAGLSVSKSRRRDEYNIPIADGVQRSLSHLQLTPFFFESISNHLCDKAFLMWRLLLFCAVAHLAHGVCPDGFDLIGDECRGTVASVMLDTTTVTGITRVLCYGILGQPVTIHNDEEQSYWTKRAYKEPESIGDPLIVLGISCNSSSKNYEWVDGSPLDYVPRSYDNLLTAKPCRTDYRFFIESDGRWASWGGNEFMVDVSCTTKLKQPIAPGGATCYGFDSDLDDGVCYQVGAAAETWKDAQMSCKQFGFPIPGLGDCVAMDTTTSAGQWMNMDCSSKLPVACMRNQSEITEPTCNSGLSTAGTVITSPGFPYNASIPCEYFLEVDPSLSVEVEINLEANPCCDFLVIHDGFLGGNMIANITGETGRVKYQSLSNMMRVSWEPSYGMNVKGLVKLTHQPDNSRNNRTAASNNKSHAHHL